MIEFLKQQNTFTLDEDLWKDAENGFIIEQFGDMFMLHKWDYEEGSMMFLRYLRSPYDLERVFFAITDEKIR